MDLRAAVHFRNPQLNIKCLSKILKYHFDSDHSEQQQQPADAGGEQKMETAEVAPAPTSGSTSAVESMEVDEDNGGATTGRPSLL